MNENVTELKVKGVRGKLELDGTQGLFFKIRLAGEVIKRKRGFWTIPMRNGSTGELHVRGMMPGFQSLKLDGTTVYQFGEGIPVAMKIVMFLPLLLVALNPLMGMVLAVVLFFLNVNAVRNTNVPAPLRYMLPVLNTGAGALAIWALSNVGS